MNILGMHFWIVSSPCRQSPWVVQIIWSGNQPCECIYGFWWEAGHNSWLGGLLTWSSSIMYWAGVLTIKLTKWIHSQRKIMNLWWFKMLYVVLLNVHEISLQPILIIFYLYLFTLHWSKVALQLSKQSWSKVMSIDLKCWQYQYYTKDILI